MICKNKGKNYSEKYFRNKLIKDNMYYVYHFVDKITKKYPDLKEIKKDLIASGIAGLVEASKTYNPYRNIKFLTYAAYYVRKNIYAEISGFINKGINKNSKTYLLEKKIKKLKSENKKTNQIAEEIGIKEKTVEKYEKNKIHNIISLDQKIMVSENESLPLHEIIPSKKNIEKEIIKKESLEKLSIVLNEGINKTLDGREKEIIKSLFFSDYKITLEDLSKKFNISKERVRQIKIKALEKLKTYLINKGYSLNDFM